MSESIPPLRIISTGSGNYIPVFELEFDNGSITRTSPIRVKYSPDLASADTSAIVYAPTGGSYITVSAEAGLAGERVLTSGSSVTLRSDATTVWIDATTANALAYAKTNLPVVIYSANAASPIALVLSGGYSVSVARTDASSIYIDATTFNATTLKTYASTGGPYITYSADTVLTGELILTAGSSITTRTDATAFYIDATTFDATTLKTYAPTGGTYLTYSSDTVLANERTIAAGSSVTIVTDATTLWINALTNAAGGVTYAPTGGNYVVFVADAGLSNEKVLTAGSSTTIVTDATTIWINALTNAGAGGATYAPTGGSYICYVADANLTAEKVLTAGSSTTIHTDATAIYINATTNAASGTSTYYIDIPMKLLTVEVDSGNVGWFAQSGGANLDNAFVRFNSSGAGEATWYCVMPRNLNSDPNWNVLVQCDAKSTSTSNVVLNVWGLSLTSGESSNSVGTVLVSADTHKLLQLGILNTLTMNATDFDGTLATSATDYVKIKIQKHGSSPIIDHFDVYNVLVKAQVDT